MASEPRRQRMKLDLPEEYARAIRVRAGLDDVDFRDVVTAALDVYLAKEIAQVKRRMEEEEEETAAGDGAVEEKKGRPKGR